MSFSKTLAIVSLAAALGLFATPLPTLASELVAPALGNGPAPSLVAPTAPPSQPLVSPTLGNGPRLMAVSPDAVPAVTMANFSRLEPGATYAEVVTILGVEGTLLSESMVGELSAVMYSWPGTNGALGANVSVLFHNDALVSKAQYGLA